MFVMLLVFGLLGLYQDFCKQYKLFNWVFCMFFQASKKKNFPSQLNQRTDSKEQFVLGSENSSTRCSLLWRRARERALPATWPPTHMRHWHSERPKTQASFRSPVARTTAVRERERERKKAQTASLLLTFEEELKTVTKAIFTRVTGNECMHERARSRLLDIRACFVFAFFF